MPNSKRNLAWQSIITLLVGLTCFIWMSVSSAEPVIPAKLETTTQLYLRPNSPVAYQQEFEVMAALVEETPKARIRYWAEKYGVSVYQMTETCRCESGFKHKGLYGSAGEYGIAQFLLTTFLQYRPRPNMEYMDLDDQLEVMAYMFSLGEQRHWTCWRVLTK